MQVENSEKYRFLYLVADNEKNGSDAYVSTVGYQRIEPGDPYPINKHPNGYFFDLERGRYLNEYQLLYITHGDGVFTDHSGSYDVRKGDIILLRPEQWHTYCPNQSSGWTEYYIGFFGQLFKEYITNVFGSQPKSVYRIGDNDELIHLFLKALDYASTQYPGTQLLLTSLVTHMIGLTNYCLTRTAYKDDHIQDMITRAKTYMHNNISQKIDIEQIASDSNVSYSWFRKIFRDHTGTSPSKYLQLLRVQRAKYLLLNSHHSIKSIAYQCGFSTPEYFCNVFHKATHQTPNEYRETLGGQ